MRAAVLSDGQMTIEELPNPQPRPGEALVQVAACGVCHTDLHVIEGHVPFPQPAVLGHEIAGTVVEVNGQSTSIKPGDRVVSSFIMPCGQCPSCISGDEALCGPFFEMNRLRGVLYDGESRLRRQGGESVSMYSMGGLAEQCVVPLTNVVPLPPELPLVPSSILGCAFFTAYGAVRRAADLRGGESVAVIGLGGVGTAIVQLAKAFGADPIIAVDIVESKLAEAMQHGATDAVCTAPGHSDPVSAAVKATRGRGADIVFDACGGSTTFALASSLVRDGGNTVIVGLTSSDAVGHVDLNRLVRRKVRVTGSYGGRPQADIEHLTRLATRGIISVDDVVTQHFTLDEAATAYKALANREITGRAVVVPNTGTDEEERVKMEKVC